MQHFYNGFFKKCVHVYNTKFYFRDDAGSETNEIKFETIEQSALCVVSDTPHMKEER
jgi:hypothetical protein